MKISEKLLQLLEVEPRARERAAKNRAIGNTIINEYGISVDKSMMQSIVGDILTLDRAWRKILEDNPHLRGTDYGQKDELELKKLKELGY